MSINMFWSVIFSALMGAGLAGLILAVVHNDLDDRLFLVLFAMFAAGLGMTIKEIKEKSNDNDLSHEYWIKRIEKLENEIENLKK